MHWGWGDGSAQAPITNPAAPTLAPSSNGSRHTLHSTSSSSSLSEAGWGEAGAISSPPAACWLRAAGTGGAPLGAHTPAAPAPLAAPAEGGSGGAADSVHPSSGHSCRTGTLGGGPQALVWRSGFAGADQGAARGLSTPPSKGLPRCFRAFLVGVRCTCTGSSASCASGSVGAGCCAWAAPTGAPPQTRGVSFAAQRSS
jgi:hypothetical protein